MRLPTRAPHILKLTARSPRPLPAQARTTPSSKRLSSCGQRAAVSATPFRRPRGRPSSSSDVLGRCGGALPLAGPACPTTGALATACTDWRSSACAVAVRSRVVLARRARNMSRTPLVFILVGQAQRRCALGWNRMLLSYGRRSLGRGSTAPAVIGAFFRLRRDCPIRAASSCLAPFTKSSRVTS